MAEPLLAALFVALAALFAGEACRRGREPAMASADLAIAVVLLACAIRAVP